MNFPLLNTFKIGEHTVDFLNRKFEQNMDEDNVCSPYDLGDPVYISKTGVYTNNLCEWDDEEFNKFLIWLKGLLAEKLELLHKEIDIHYTHYFDYQQGGLVKIHDHVEHEDYVMIMYLNSSSSGSTIFYLNPEERARSRTTVELEPRKGLVVLFSSMVKHEVKYTEEFKRIFVAGVRINTKGGVQ